MNLSLIRLELARGKDHPNGSTLRGYEMIAPLDESGHLNSAEWRKCRARCSVRRFWNGEPDRHGELVHTAGGKWAISYDPSTDLDDEPIFRLDSHFLSPGNYVSITEADHTQHTYRVVSIKSSS